MKEETKLKCCIKEDQDQDDVIVKQVLFLVDEEEFCKVKKSQGVMWPKNLGRKKSCLWNVFLGCLVGQKEGMKGKQLASSTSSMWSIGRNGG